MQSQRVVKLDRDLAKSMFYQGNVSLGIFEENRHLKRTLQELAAEVGLGGYVPPKRFRMAGELLDFHYTELKHIVDKQLLIASSSEACLYLTQTFDGWTMLVVRICSGSCLCRGEELCMSTVSTRPELISWARIGPWSRSRTKQSSWVGILVLLLWC